MRIEPLPEGWTDVHLSDICTRVQDSQQPTLGGTTPYVGLEHLAPGFPSLLGRGVDGDVTSSKAGFRAGDVLFGKLRPYLRKAAQPDFDGVCSTDILVFRNNEDYEPAYLKYLVHADEFIEHAKATTSGVQHPRTSWSSLREFKLSAPPRNEQRRIAHVLGTVQQAIEQQERLIRSTTELKQAMMQKLFTEGLRGEAQKETEIGLVPVSWEVVELDDVFKFTSGKPKPRDTAAHKCAERPYPVYGGNGVMGYSAEKLLDHSTLILGRVGEYCGCAHLTEPAAWITDNALYVKEDKLQPNYQYLRDHLDYLDLNRYSNKMGQPLITQGIIGRVRFGLPTRKEQDAIATTLLAVKDRSRIAERKRTALQDLFRTLLHEMMTGKVRVNIPSIE